MCVCVTKNNYVNQSFGSRNLEIRDADRILRKLRHIFYQPSQTKLEANYDILLPPNKQKFHYKKILQNMFCKLRIQRNSFLYSDAFSQVFMAKNCVEKSGIANCGEMAILARAALKTNGYKDATIHGLSKESVFISKRFGINRLCETELDHAVVVFNKPKNFDPLNPSSYGKAIIFDMWSGFTDYLSKGLKNLEKYYLKNEISKINLENNMIKNRLILNSSIAKTSNTDIQKMPSDMFIQNFPYLKVLA